MTERSPIKRQEHSINGRHEQLGDVFWDTAFYIPKGQS
jgi:hypothetical protein